MSNMKLKELIKQVRQCKTAAEERAVIHKEMALIRNAFKDEQVETRPKNIAKLLFMNLLSYATPFAQIECLKLIASPSYTDKRVGYLALVQMFTEDSDILLMVTNTLKMDLGATQVMNINSPR